MLKLTDYANGADIQGGKVSAVQAFQTAFGYAVGYREPLWVPPGDYLIDQSLNIPDSLEMFGNKKLTQLIHAPGFYGPVIFAHTTRDAVLRDFYVSGGLGREPLGTNPLHYLNHDSYGYFGAEAYFGGIDNVVSGVVFTEWNSIGAVVYGDNLRMERCWGRKIPPPIYKPDSGPTASRDFGGTFAFVTPATLVCRGLRMLDCGATGTRGPGGFVGGVYGAIDRWYSDDCHREYCPSNPYGFTSGGGQLALSPTKAPGGADGGQQAQHWTISSPFISYSAGPAVSGLELDHAWGVDVLNPHIMGNRQGISINNCRMIRVTSGIVGGTSMRGAAIFDSSYVSISTGFEFCNTAVEVTGTCNEIDLRGSVLYANAIGVQAGPNVSNIHYP